ncbi:MAG TPA: galactose oxidase early set domain-containing protein [Burkholderiales bacterium]|nr:galactose oxidase early set domain-containing protein [Burkholderiales bacterium]
MKKQFGAFLVSLVLIGTALAQQAVDAWAPAGSQAPIEFRVNDPINGNIQFRPVHGTLLPDGRVMLFATVGVHARAAWFVPTPIGDPLPATVTLNADHVPVDVDPPITVTDPATGNRLHVEETIFCSGHTLTADGGIFVAGGTLLYSLFQASTQTTINWIYGMPNVTQYSAASGTWSRGENMRGTGETGSNLRWYGTVTRLADQRMLVSSGFELASIQVRAPNQPVQHHGTRQNRSVEVMLPAGGGHVVSTHAQSPREIWNPDYTHAFQVPYGPPVVPTSTVLMFGDAGVPVYLLADAAPGTGWITLGDQRRPGTVAADAPNHGTASVLLPMRANNFEWGYANGSVMQAGGGRESQMERSIDFFELSTGSWGQGIDLGLRRRFPATVLLPDGKVVVVSGYDATNANPLLRNAHYLDVRPPAAFSTGTAASGEVRGYHNVALLLADGRVLIGGGRSAGETGPEDEKPTFRYLYPPYLSPLGSPPPRPVITAAPQTIGYGSDFTVEFSGGPVSEVVLMGLGSMTHAFDMNQRYVQLATTSQSASTVQVTGPENIQTAPPGHYMLFVLNQNRVPSVAAFVRVVP